MQNKSKTQTILLVVTLASLLTSFSGSSVNVALPVIAKELGITAVYLSWVPTIYLLFSAILLIPMGRLADIVGRKKIFVTGIIIFSFSSLLCALVSSGTALIFARASQGIGASMVFATSVAILISAFPIGQRGKAIGFNTASVYVGLSIGPFLGGILTHYIGWRSIFFVSVAIGLINLPFIFFKIHDEWHESKGEPFDFTGSIVYAVSLSAMIIGFSFLPKITGIFMTFCGISGLVVFTIFESKTSHPVLNVGLFLENKVFAFSNFAAAINYSATASVAFFLSLYLQIVKGFTPQEAGFILVAQPIVQALLSPMTGHISDRVEPRILSSLGMSFTASGLFLLSVFTHKTGVPMIMFCLVLFGLGFALFASPNTNAIMSSVEKKHLGIASSTLATMRIVGQMMSMGIATLLVAVFIGNVKLTSSNSDDFIRAMTYGFHIFAVLCVVGIYFSWSRGRAGHIIRSGSYKE